MNKTGDFVEQLRAAGYKSTKPRRVVAAVLQAHANNHLSANEIYEQVQAVDSSIGRMSVYRTLDLFMRLGYIHPAPQSAADTRSGVVYVIMRDGHHHHIVCKQCNRVIEFEECSLGHLIQRLEASYGCKIEGHLLEFFGVCAVCIAEN